MQIEYRRKDLARLPDFEPYRVFQGIDTEKKGELDGSDIERFLREHYYDVTEEQVLEFIKEFDADEDSKLSFEEFLQIVLPATNPNLRHITMMRKNSYLYLTEQRV